MLRYVTLLYVMLLYVTLCYVTLCYVTLCYCYLRHCLSCYMYDNLTSKCNETWHFKKTRFVSRILWSMIRGLIGCASLHVAELLSNHDHVRDGRGNRCAHKVTTIIIMLQNSRLNAVQSHYQHAGDAGSISTAGLMFASSGNIC